MGGIVIETESERIRKDAKTQIFVEMRQEDGFDNLIVLKRLQDSRIIDKVNYIRHTGCKSLVCFFEKKYMKNMEMEL